MKRGIKTINIVSWNILAASRAVDTFDGVDNACLAWEHRLSLVLDQLACTDFDVAVLIEVEQVQFDTLSRALDGYGHLYLPKPVDALPDKDAFANHGIALFYRIGAVRVNEYGSVRLPPTQQAIFADLTFEGESMHLVACHLKSRPENASMREAQAYEIGRHPSLLQNARRPMLLIGDFNEVMKGSMDDNVCTMFGKFLYANAVSYNHWAPAFSTWKSRDGVEVKHAIDHVFHTESLHLLDTAGTPQPQTMLPNAYFPSDHVPLVLQVAWTLCHADKKRHPITYPVT